MFEFGEKFMEKARLVSARSGVVFEWKIIYGDVVGLDIINFAAQKRFDLIVISSRGFGNIKEMFLGSVTHRVVHKSTVPVLAVK